jgi:hypothetical protein
LHLRLSLAVAQIPESPAQRRYFETLEQVLERGPAGDQAEALARVSDDYLQVLAQQPSSDALKLAQGAVVQLQNSWRAWCRQHEAERGELSHGLA